ncbi:membrane protein [Enterobacter asburiae]|nr:membrane protein [Enterobacter asburiae]
MKKPVAIILVVVVLLAAGVGGWLWYQSHQDKGLTLYGNVDIRTVNMSFRVGGRLASLSVDEAMPLKAGRRWGCWIKRPMKMRCCRPKRACPSPRRSMT